MSHRLDEIFKIADRVVVLGDGQMIGMRHVDHTTPEELVSLIVSRKAREINRPPVQPGPEILRVQDLKTPRNGPADLRGTGHEDIGRSLFGTIAHLGVITLIGQTPDLRSPRMAMQGAEGSGYTSPLHVVTKANIGFDGGEKNILDLGNGYRDEYAKIWGKM